MPLIFHPGFGETLSYSTVQLPDDPDGQVEGTIELMGQYAGQDAAHPLVAEEARQCLASYPGLTPEEAVFYWIRSKVGFQRDEAIGSYIPVPENEPLIEVLIRPVDMILLCSSGKRSMGDCDDFSTYGAALLLAMGRYPRFVTVAADHRNPEVYSHVYLASYDSLGNRFPLDISHGSHPGWEVQNQFDKRREWPITRSFTGLDYLVLAGAALWWFSRRRRTA